MSARQSGYTHAHTHPKASKPERKPLPKMYTWHARQAWKGSPSPWKDMPCVVEGRRGKHFLLLLHYDTNRDNYDALGEERVWLHCHNGRYRFLLLAPGHVRFGCGSEHHTHARRHTHTLRAHQKRTTEARNFSTAKPTTLFKDWTGKAGRKTHRKYAIVGK